MDSWPNDRMTLVVMANTPTYLTRPSERSQPACILFSARCVGFDHLQAGNRLYCSKSRIGPGHARPSQILVRRKDLSGAAMTSATGGYC